MTATTHTVTPDDIRDIAHDAQTAFWVVVAKRFPEAVMGDFDPVDAQQFTEYCERIVRTWVQHNVPGRVMFKDWDTIEFPQFLRDLGFEDRSWHNDLCARAELTLPGYSEDNGYPALTCWCEHAATEDREFHDFPLYRLEANITAASGDPQDLNVLYEGDDPAECEKAVQNYLQRKG